MARRTAGVFVTGTDTGVGKTVVACALLDLLVAEGLATAAYKPVAAGARSTPRGLRNDDAERLLAHATLRTDYGDVNPVVLEPPIAPHLAARQRGLEIDLERLAHGGQRLAGPGRFVVAEGAGGWLVPLGPRHTMADLAARLGWPVLLVVGLRLGCLNHSLLTVESIVRRGRRLAGWIANEIEPDMTLVTENVAALAERSRAPLLGRVGWLGEYSETDRPGAALASLDRTAIRAALL
jgi:dethiobiotin synthetase